tara:strand:- start:200 stop:490 length:291 start_codon:yes stop_codon:yes gene_type:complete
MNIQNINNLPDFIDKFIKFNHDKLIEIYNEGIKNHKEGILYFQCEREKNNVDVFFLYKEKIIEMISEENWKMLKQDASDKKIFFIKENNNIFILKI